MVRIIIIILVIACLADIIPKLIKAAIEKKREQEALKRDPVESFVPETVMNSVFKCPSCGASVPAKTNDHITTFCPFCGSKLEGADKIMEQAAKEKDASRSFELERMKLKQQERQTMLEEQRIKAAKHKTTMDNIIIFLCIGLMIFLFLGMIGVFNK